MPAVREWAASWGSNLSAVVTVNNSGKWKTAKQMTSLTILIAIRYQWWSNGLTTAKDLFLLANKEVMVITTHEVVTVEFHGAKWVGSRRQIMDVPKDLQTVLNATSTLTMSGYVGSLAKLFALERETHQSEKALKTLDYWVIVSNMLEKLATVQYKLKQRTL